MGSSVKINGKTTFIGIFEFRERCHARNFLHFFYFEGNSLVNNFVEDRKKIMSVYMKIDGTNQ